MFRCILDLFCYSTKLGAKRIELVQLMKNSCHEIASEFFAMNAPDPRHWTLNSWIGAFCSVWVHFGLFHCCMKLGAKRAELMQLMQNFMPRTRIGIFGNERTQSTRLDPKLKYFLFRTVWVHFGFVSSLHETRCNTGWTSAFNEEVRATKLHQSFPQWTYPIHPILR